MPVGQTILAAAPEGRLWSAGASFVMQKNLAEDPQAISGMPLKTSVEVKGISNTVVRQDSFFPQNGNTSIFGLGVSTNNSGVVATQDFEWSASPSGLVQVCKTYTVNGTAKLDPIRSGPYFGSDGAAYYYGTTIDATGKVGGSTIYLRQTPVDGVCSLVSKDNSDRALVQVWKQSNGSFLVERVIHSDPINWATTEVGLLSGGVMTMLVSPDATTHPTINATACCDMLWDLGNQSALVTYRDGKGGHAFLYQNDKIVPVYDNDGRASQNIRALALNGKWALFGVSTQSPFGLNEILEKNTETGQIWSIARTGEVLAGLVPAMFYVGTAALGPDGKVSFGTSDSSGNVKWFVVIIPGVTGFPTILSFTADPSAVIEGDPVTVSWVTDAASVTINQGVGTVPTSGKVTVTPTVSTPYTLTATSPAGSTSSTVTVTVTPRAIVPMIADGGVINAASFTPPLSPGTYASIFGVNLSDSTAAAIAPYPSLLSGVMVLVNGVFVPVQYASPKQINFLIPYDAALGKANVQVLRNGIAGNIATITISATSPGVFTSGDLGIATDSNGRLITADNPLALGTPNILWLTGLGGTTCLVQAGVAPNAICYALIQPTLTIGGTKARIDFAGLSPQFPGLYQINFVLGETQTIPSQSALVEGVVLAGDTQVKFQIMSQQPAQ